jgi:CxxC motif-containing protein (DUF1111 family)
MGRTPGRSGNRCLRRGLFVELRAVLSGIAAIGLVAAIAAPLVVAADEDGKKPSRQAVAQGRVLFEREWQPGDSRTHNGDGLGPVYNDSSCVSCHNLGGTGGAGPSGKNVDIVTATPIMILPPPTPEQPEKPGFLRQALRSLIGIDSQKPPGAPAPGTPAGQAKPARPKVDTTELVKAHPGFRNARSVVLHRFSTEENYERWRSTLLGIPMMANDQLAINQMVFQSAVVQNQIGPFSITRSQRNPTSLWGAGLIDSIAESDIEAGAKVKFAGFPEIAGRVSRLKDKRIGRFGWKSQTASLKDFVLTACAVELGLEVPDHHQAGSPVHPDAQAKGLDLNGQECDSLVAFVSDLPRPSEPKPGSEREGNEIQAGRALFAKVGCATCHAAKLGKVEGLYSDLLLHDLGPGLGDVGQYGVFDPSSSEDEIVDDPATIAEAAPAPDFAPTTVQTAIEVTQSAAGAPAQAPPNQAVAIPPPPVTPAEVTIAAAANSTVAVAPAPTVQVSSPFDVVPQMGGMAGQFNPSGQPIKRPTSGPASRFEWRTPPLWGFRDSGPYLHDGRAQTLDQAVAFHGGEATAITQKFTRLSIRERRQLETFLKTLTAPTAAELAANVK